MCTLWVIIIKYGSCGVSFHSMFYSIYSHCLCFHVCDMFPYMFYYIDRFCSHHVFPQCMHSCYMFLCYIWSWYMLLYTLYFVEVYFILCWSILLTKCTQTSHKILYTLVLAYRLSLDIPYQKWLSIQYILATLNRRECFLDI